MRLPTIRLQGRFGKKPEKAVSAAVLAGIGVALLVAYALVVHVALLFQNLYQSTFVLVPGARIGQDYWRSVDYGLTMAVLVGALSVLLLLIAAVEIVRLVSAGRWR